MLHTQIKREPTAFTEGGLLTPADSFRTPSVPSSIQIDLTSDEEPDHSTPASTAFSNKRDCKEEEKTINVTDFPKRSQSGTTLSFTFDILPRLIIIFSHHADPTTSRTAPTNQWGRIL